VGTPTGLFADLLEAGEEVLGSPGEFDTSGPPAHGEVEGGAMLLF
jgi:hypothetical protein